MGLLSLFKKKREEEPKCSAVIVSAGLARRMGGIDKVLAPLGELPVLVHTLYAFQDCPVIDEIVVVAREDLVVDVGRLCREFNLDKVRKVIVGGQERIHSVQAGLREERSTVSTTRPPSVRLTVSVRGMAGAAAPVRAARATVSRMISWGTRGRAPSWMATNSAPEGSSPSPARTEWVRVAPPTITLRTLDKPASRQSWPMGTIRSSRVTTIISAR